METLLRQVAGWEGLLEQMEGRALPENERRRLSGLEVLKRRFRRPIGVPRAAAEEGDAEEVQQRSLLRMELDLAVPTPPTKDWARAGTLVVLNFSEWATPADAVRLMRAPELWPALHTIETREVQTFPISVQVSHSWDALLNLWEFLHMHRTGVTYFCLDRDVDRTKQLLNQAVRVGNLDLRTLFQQKKLGQAKWANKPLVCHNYHPPQLQVVTEQHNYTHFRVTVKGCLILWAGSLFECQFTIIERWMQFQCQQIFIVLVIGQWCKALASCRGLLRDCDKVLIFNHWNAVPLRHCSIDDIGGYLEEAQGARQRFNSGKRSFGSALGGVGPVQQQKYIRHR